MRGAKEDDAASTVANGLVQRLLVNALFSRVVLFCNVVGGEEEEEEEDGGEQGGCPPSTPATTSGACPVWTDRPYRRTRD